MIRATLVAAVLVAALSGSAAALPPPCGISLCIRLTPEGPTPAVVESWPGQTVWFTSQQPTHSSEITVEGSVCRPHVGVGIFSGCPLRDPGRYPYSVTGFGAGQGTIVVRTVEWVTIAPTRATVVYGRGLRLTGRAYFPPRPGDPPRPPTSPIHVRGNPTAGRTTRTEGTVLDASRQAVVMPAYGEWSAIMFPRIATVYTVGWGGHRSVPAEVAVRPSVAVRVRGHELRVAVRPAAPWRGRRAVLQRQRPDGSWYDAARVRLDADARARTRVPRGTGPLRAVVPPAAGYVAGWSRPLVAPSRTPS